MPVSARPLRFPVSPPGRHKNASIWDAFSFQLHFLPIRTPMCPFGCVGGLWQVLHSQTHMGHFFVSSYILSTSEHHQHTQMGTLVVFGCLSSTPTPPSKQAFSYLQCAYLAMLVFGPPAHFSYCSLLPFLPYSHFHISYFLFSYIFFSVILLIWGDKI